MFETKIVYLEVPEEEEVVFHGIIEASTEVEGRKLSLAHAVTFHEKSRDFVIGAIVDREGLKQIFNEEHGTVEYYKLDEFGNVVKTVSIMVKLEPLKTLMSSGTKGFHAFPEVTPNKSE